MAKILIVEDEETLLRILERKLSNEGYDTDIARDGEEALGRMKSEVPDLILLDIVMPKLDGFAVMRAMQEDKRLKDVPIIIISNSGQPVEIEEAKKLGAQDYLVKADFDIEEVMEKVRGQLKEEKKGADEQAEEAAEPSTQKEASSSGNNGNKILIIEDDQFLRELLAKKLSLAGFAVTQSIDGETGLNKIKEDKPQLVLLDLILPGIDGFELLKRMREDKNISGIPVLVLSNLGQKEDVRRALDLGAKDYLIKAHFTLDEIISKIKALL